MRFALIIYSWSLNDCLSSVFLRLLWFLLLCFRLSFDFRVSLLSCLLIRFILDFRVSLLFDFQINTFLDLWNLRILLMSFFLDLWILLMNFLLDLWILRVLFFRSLNSSFFRFFEIFSSHSASVMSHVAISKTSDKKKRVKILNMFESVNFFRDANMFNNDAKMKNAKKISIFAVW